MTDNKKPQQQNQPAPDDGADSDASIEETQASLQEIQQQIDEITAALQRERADAINLRRQYSEQMASMKAVAKAEVIRELLPVIDNLERALKHVPKELDGNEYVKGVQGVVKQFEKALTGLGVTKIETVGKPFDPRYHEAVSMEEGDGEREVVSEEVQSGYVLGDTVLRHAFVKVKTQ